MGLESTDQCGKTLAKDVLGSDPAISSNEHSVYFAQNLRVSGVIHGQALVVLDNRKPPVQYAD